MSLRARRDRSQEFLPLPLKDSRRNYLPKSTSAGMSALERDRWKSSAPRSSTNRYLRIQFHIHSQVQLVLDHQITVAPPAYSWKHRNKDCSSHLPTRPCCSEIDRVGTKQREPRLDGNHIGQHHKVRNRWNIPLRMMILKSHRTKEPRSGTIARFQSIWSRGRRLLSERSC